jgi:hypothetical protein
MRLSVFVPQTILLATGLAGQLAYAMDPCFVMNQAEQSTLVNGASVVHVQGTPTLEVLSGGLFGRGEKLGAGEFNTIYSATVRSTKGEHRAAEKMYFITPTNKSILDRSVIAAREAYGLGLGPEVYGVRDVVLSSGSQMRLVYSYEVGSHPDVVRDNGKLLAGDLSKMRGRFSEATPESRAAAEQKIAQIRAKHPDGSDQNIMVELRRGPNGEKVLEIFGIDWDPNTEMVGWSGGF